MSINNPLTSNINTLTEFANSVTGESDTNLSDAVHTLADGYGQGTSWTKIAETEHSFQITGTSIQNVFTWRTEQSNIWTSNKIIYIRIRDKAGPRIGYFYGSDTFFICRYPINNNSSGQTDFNNNETSVTFIDFDYEGYVVNTTPKHGLYVNQLTTTGTIYFYGPDTTQHSIINGTYTIELYTLEPTASIFENFATLSYLDASYTSNEGVLTTTPLDSLRSNLRVTAHYSEGSPKILPDFKYKISGQLRYPNEWNSISVHCGDKTAQVLLLVQNDYSFDALTNVTWESGFGIGDGGSIIPQQNSYISSFFSAQDCIYLLKSTDTSIDSMELHIWLNGGTDIEEYYGFFKTTATSDSLYQMTKTQLLPWYDYRVVIKTSNSFNPSTITLLPVDNRETAVPHFSIPLWEYVDSFGVTDGGAVTNNHHINGELDITSIFEEHGIPINNCGPYIHSVDYFARVKGTSTSSGAGVNHSGVKTDNMLTIAHVPWQGKLYLQFCVGGITTLQDLKDYITNYECQIYYNKYIGIEEDEVE